jgi:hypothetical protein
MRTGRPTPPLCVSEDQRRTLEEWVRRRKTAQALSLRARMILGCASGANNTQVAAEMGVKAQTVGNGGPAFWSREWTGYLTNPGRERPEGSAMPM